MSRFIRPTFLLEATLIAAVLLPSTSPAQNATDRRAVEHRYQERLQNEQDFLCGTAQAMFPELRRVSRTPAGAPVYYDQDPPILTGNYRGKVTLRNFTVVGDVSSITFEPNIVDTNSPIKKEKWKRKRTATIAGVKVSIFEPSWNAHQVDRFFYAAHSGFDWPDLYWGTISAPSGSRFAAGNADYAVFIRVAPSDLPDVTVRTIDATAAYSASVVNLVIPDFGDDRISMDPFEVQETEVARLFYQYFQDVYQALAIVPRQVNLASDFFAFHQPVANAVRGIGLQEFDDSAAFGSGGTLQAIEYYPNAGFGHLSTTVHEEAHQWGHYLDWGAIAGITRAGHQPSAHTPLIDGGETLIGAVLEETRKVVTGTGRSAERAGDYVVAVSEAPHRYHPLTLYAMGWLGSGRVPGLNVFADQRQFDADTSSDPDPGMAVAGATVGITIDDIIGIEGARSGPKAPRKWNRVTVVVSRNAPLTQAEWNYWTWITQTQTYRKKDGGVTTFYGAGTYRQATGGKLSLMSNVAPRSSPPIKQKLKVGFPAFSRNAWRGIQFDKNIPTKIKAGQRVHLSGRVTANDRSDFNWVLLSFVPYNPATGGVRIGLRSGPRGRQAPASKDTDLYFEVDSSGRFDGSHVFDKDAAGRYLLADYLFWPGSGSQYSRATRTTLTVQ